jgi:two-component system response regulator NreC
MRKGVSVSPNSKIRVLVVEDHHLVRAGIVALLNNERDIHVVGEADNGLDAVQKAKDLSPHVVLMDISMPTMDGVEATYQITNAKPMTKVLVLTQHDNEEYIKRVMQSGASGYLLKVSVAEELLRAIRAVYRGEQFFTPSLSKLMIDSYVKHAKGELPQKGYVSLTHREREILKLIAEGSTNQQIAVKLNISVRTVEFHRANLTAKIGVHDTVGLVKYAIRRKIISVDI